MFLKAFSSEFISLLALNFNFFLQLSKKKAAQENRALWALNAKQEGIKETTDSQAFQDETGPTTSMDNETFPSDGEISDKEPGIKQKSDKPQKEDDDGRNTPITAKAKNGKLRFLQE